MSAKKARDRADRYFSLRVRSLGYCQRCGTRGGEFDCAHVIRRRHSRVRCVDDNAWCLCRGCHTTVDQFPSEHARLVEATIGWDRLRELEELARDTSGQKVDWFEEADVQLELWKAVRDAVA